MLLERDLNFPNFPMIFGSGSNRIQDMYNDFFEQVLNPLCAYIDERIDEGDLLLYSLSRYQRECSWFEADALAKLAEEAESAKLKPSWTAISGPGSSVRALIIRSRLHTARPAPLMWSSGMARNRFRLK